MSFKDGAGPGPGYEWPDLEHGIFVDYKENVWITGNGGKDTNILKFTRNGKFLLQIGHHGKSGGNNDTENLNRPAGIVVYPKTNEVLVADGVQQQSRFARGRGLLRRVRRTRRRAVLPRS